MPTKRITIYPATNPDPGRPLAVLYPDGRVEGTDDPELLQRIRAAIDDDQVELLAQLPGLDDDPAWQRHYAAIDDPAALSAILHDIPADLAQAMARHQVVIGGPASRFDPTTPEWAWLVWAALVIRKLEAAVEGYGLPTGATGVGYSVKPGRREG
jgi:hypothetical protein